MRSETRGRPPHWPRPWLDLAALVGGTVALRRAFGYSSKTTLSAKIARRSPWSRADVLLLGGLLRRHGLNLKNFMAGDVLAILLSPEELSGLDL